MLDYLQELWNKTSYAYKFRLEILNKLASCQEVDDVYATLTFETTILAG